MTVDDQPATDESADKHIQKTLDAAPPAGNQFGDAGGCGVFGKHHRQVGHGLDPRANIDAVPLAGIFRRNVQQFLPSTKLKRRGDADPA